MWDNDRAGPSKCWGKIWDLETDAKLWVQIKSLFRYRKTSPSEDMLKMYFSIWSWNQVQGKQGTGGTRVMSAETARQQVWTETGARRRTTPGEKTSFGSFYNLQAKHEKAFSTHSNCKDQSWQYSSKSLGDGRWWRWERQRKGQDLSSVEGKEYHAIQSSWDKIQRFKDCVLMPHRYSRKTYKNNRIIIKRSWEETWRGRGEYVPYPHLLWSWWSDSRCMSDLTSYRPPLTHL